MPNEKTHFIAGAVVGATVNLTIQIAQMAMDYDRPFDWSEFFLCTGAGAFAGLTGFHESNALPLPVGRGEGWPALRSAFDEGGGEGEGNVRISITQNVGIVDLLLPRQFFHTILSAALVAWAISGKHTLKFSRATRLALWAFGISHLSHIALDCTSPKRINLI